MTSESNIKNIYLFSSLLHKCFNIVVALIFKAEVEAKLKERETVLAGKIGKLQPR